jgi:hypothetical protein
MKSHPICGVRLRAIAIIIFLELKGYTGLTLLGIDVRIHSGVWILGALV